MYVFSIYPKHFFISYAFFILNFMCEACVQNNVKSPLRDRELHMTDNVPACLCCCTAL